MAIDVANFDRCKRRLVSLLNDDDEDAPYTGVPAAFGEWTSAEYDDAIHEGDTQFVLAIVGNPTHPFRNKFITGSTPSELTSGALVPEYTGISDKVECQLTAGSAWVTGKLCRNMTRFQQILADTDVPADVKQRYYFREGGRIYTAGVKARVFAPTFNQDRSAPYVLQSPVDYERGIIAWGCAGLYKGTTDESVHEFYQKQAEKLLQTASSGQTTLPEFEKFKRRDG